MQLHLVEVVNVEEILDLLITLRMAAAAVARALARGLLLISGKNLVGIFKYLIETTQSLR